jgi:DnaK suppressor protein
VKAAAKGGSKPASKPASIKPAVSAASKPAPSVATKTRAVTKAAQKQPDKKLVDRAKASAIVLPPDYRPSEDEPFMNEYQRLYFRQKLINWKEDIIRQTKETLEGLHEDSVQHADLADRATSETDRALELRARDRQRKLISKIDAALARIEDGTYGYCEETGEPIGLKRLDARPIATLSLEAQERHERRERVYRED